MKIIVKIGLETDGDYSLMNFKKYNMEYDGSGYYHEYTFDDECKNTLYPYEDTSYTQFDAYWRAIRLLEHVLCDIHVLYTHHYVLGYLYRMFDNSIRDLHDRLHDIYHEVNGNYEGTYIEISVTE